MAKRAELLIVAGLAAAWGGCAERKTQSAADAATAPAPAQVRPAPAPPPTSLPAPAAMDAGAAQAAGAKGLTPSPAALAEAAQIFSVRCTVCHGPLGKGDGPGSQGLTPKPRNLTDTKWQAEVNDEYLEKIILYGGLAVGRSAAMPPNTDLTSKPEVIAGLRAHVRSLSGK